MRAFRHLFIAVFVTLISISTSAQFEVQNLLLTEEKMAQKYDVYMYQRQAMKQVSWMYAGYAPRAIDADKIKVYISKLGHTMRVNLTMNPEDVADYPAYLVRRGKQVAQLVQSAGVKLYEEAAFKRYLAEIARIEKDYEENMKPGFTQEKYDAGLQLLKEKFKENIFPLSEPSDSYAPYSYTPSKILGVFVYPITTFADGTMLPPDGEYIQQNGFVSADSAIQERRTQYNERVWYDSNSDGKDDAYNIVIKYIFSGFPAFWLNPSGVGIGVHGPIRYSRLTDAGGMLNSWKMREFLGLESVSNAEENIEEIKFRWDLVRTNNSHGCFRAEPMELRHLLPMSKEEIYRKVVWKVQTDLDTFTVPGTAASEFVDVKYYVLSPYSNPASKEEWFKLKFGRKADEILSNTRTFPYLDPGALEYYPEAPMSEKQLNSLQGLLNSAGGLGVVITTDNVIPSKASPQEI